MKTAAFLFAAILMLPTSRFFPGGGEPVPIIHEEHIPTVAVASYVDIEREGRFDRPTFDGTVEWQVWLALKGLGRGEHDYECALFIFLRESTMNPDAVGDSGDSHGLGQRNAPANGMPPSPWPVADQVKWFDGYAHDRYGGWCPAADKWLERAAARGGKGWW